MIVRFATLIAVFLLGACAGLPEPGGVPERRDAPAPGEAPPRAVAALQQRADMQLASGDPAAAAATLERAVNIAPGEPGPWIALGWTRLVQGDTHQAQALAQRALALGPAPAAECEARRLQEAATQRVVDPLRARDRARVECRARVG